MPFHWGRFRGLALNNGRPELAEIIGDNIFFDTCVYHQPGINLLAEVVPADNILFASEMVGAVKGVDPKTGFYFDDTKRYVDKAPGSAIPTDARFSRAMPARSTAASRPRRPRRLPSRRDRDRRDRVGKISAQGETEQIQRVRIGHREVETLGLIQASGPTSITAR